MLYFNFRKFLLIKYNAPNSRDISGYLALEYRKAIPARQ